MQKTAVAKNIAFQVLGAIIYLLRLKTTVKQKRGITKPNHRELVMQDLSGFTVPKVPRRQCAVLTIMVGGTGDIIRRRRKYCIAGEPFAASAWRQNWKECGYSTVAKLPIRGTTVGDYAWWWRRRGVI